MKAKSDNYDKVVAAFVAVAESVTAEQVTPEMIAESFTETGNADVAEIQAQLDAVTVERDNANTRVTELEAELADFKEVPANPSAESKRDGDVDKTETLAAFADRNSGNTATILEKLKKEGLI